MTSRREHLISLALAQAMAEQPFRYDELEKRLTPPAGYSLAPRSKIGAYRKRQGKTWVYWDPRDADKRLPGGDDWWKHYGMRKNPGDWDGTWADTSTDDPAGYDKQGVLQAADRMLALREARQQGNVPMQLLEAAALFAITSKRTTSEKQEQIWGQVDAWLASDERDPEKLRAIMRPLGMQNSRLAEMQSVQANLEGIRAVLLRHPTDGRAARRELMSGRMFKGLGMAKATFLLELMGYSDVACIDSVVANYLTGDRTPKRLPSLLAKKMDLYEAFEDALSRSQAYRESDPEAVRLGMAQWRAWDHHRGSDTDHAVFWNSARRIMGDIIKAARTQDMMAAVMGYAVDRFGLDHPVWYHVHRGE